MHKGTSTQQMEKVICSIIPTYNRVEILQQSLQHVQAQTIKPSTIIIVDNGSTDGTREFLQTLQNDDTVKCIFLNANMGAGYAISVGMKYGLTLKEYDYFWILDDDSYYKNDTLEELVRNIQNSPFALLGLTAYNIRLGQKREIDNPQKLQKVDYAVIDGSLIKTEAIKKIGTTYEHFFMMCDDDEYILRLKKHGFKIGWLNINNVERLHLGSEEKFSKATLWRGYYQSRNQLLILKKYFSISHLMGYLIRESKFIVGAALFAPDKFTRVKFRLLGIFHGLRGIKGKTLDPGSLEFIKPRKRNLIK